MIWKMLIIGFENNTYDLVFVLPSVQRIYVLVEFGEHYY